MAGFACRRLLIAALLGACMLSVPGRVADAMPRCGARADLVAEITSRYRETLRATGLIAAHGKAELFLSDEGTWTLIATLPDGKSCIVAAGRDWDGTAGLVAGTGI